MKRLTLLLIALATFAGLSAAKIDRETAIRAAHTRVEGEVESVRLITHEGQPAYYIVQLSRGGWAVVSADDMSQPIIGYSDEGTFQTEGQPINVRGMMEQYAEQVVRNARLTGERHDGWSLDAPAARTRAASDVIAPLITVNWNQTGAFQRYCPSDKDGQAVVGCVAVGMAQAMSVARWPKHATGSYGYTSATYGYQYIDFDAEPAYNWNDILSGANGRDDVARLLWHCGVAVSMDYGVDGSGSQTRYIATALQRNFGYPASVRFYSRSAFGDDWQDLVLNELKEGRAVAYSGTDPKKNYGHCFNLDGYDGSFFHVNWGWGGSNNGYFSLDGLRDATMDMDYTDGQGIIIGVRAPSDKPSNVDLSNKTVQAGRPAGTLVGDVVVESEAENPVYTYQLKGKYSARQHKYLDAPFEVVGGQLVTTKELSEGTQEVTITVTNVANLGQVERTFIINVTTEEMGIDAVATDVSEGSILYYSPSGVRRQAAQRGINIVRNQATGRATIIVAP